MNQLIKNKLKVKLIKKPLADSIIKKYHYSGKVVQNSKLNFGVYYDDVLEGANTLIIAVGIHYLK